ncbi:hypothetical protein DAEQUDRAFT_810529 [Daedalea quercina L-15889]|uniref:Peptidase C14 caspase domain-containing protein n=1 Tax=Daedalea quercina L-15889 TaxID=1314783 RepID=A0A165REI3_9APHY|nr:hypothetical protein DAEQUDRAFT_810529 [Daedalea quercina L-15889]
MVIGIEQQVEAQVLPRQRSVFALIVAINEYQNRKIPRLQGCVNDGKDFQDFLTATRNVPSGNILMLLNESATRENILTAFRSHLIDNERVIEGDLIFFFYAGHGDSVDAPEGWNADGGRVETICPYDVTVFEDTERRFNVDSVADATYGIPDRTFNALMRLLARKKGDNVVAIFDCCHSGGIMRDMEDAEMPPRSLSNYSEAPQRPPLPPDLDKELLTELFSHTPHAGRSLSFVVPPGFAYSGTKSHVLLAACQANEKAREHKAKDLGLTRGRFTFHLLRYLRSMTPDHSQLLTYATLIEITTEQLTLAKKDGGSDVKDHHADDALVQRPHCEGRHKRRILFSTEEADMSESFPLAYELIHPDTPQYALYVAAGLVHGVVHGDNGTKFAYLCRNASSMPEVFTSLVLFPSRVEAHRSMVEVGEADRARIDLVSKEALDTLSEPPMVNVLTWGSKPMKVWCPPDIPLVLREDTGNRSGFERARVREDADVALYKADGVYVLERRDTLITRFAIPKLELKNIDIDADAILGAAAKFYFHLYRFNHARAVRTDLSYIVQLHPLKRRQDSGLQALYVVADGSKDLFADASMLETPVSGSSTYELPEDEDARVKQVTIRDTAPYYGLTVVNRSRFDLFVHAFYFDPRDFSITEWYHPPNVAIAPLSRDGKLEIGYGADAHETLQFSFGEGVREETGFLKIFVSNVYVDLSGLVQSPWGVGGRGVTRVPTRTVAGWNSSTYVLTVAQP